MNRLRCFIALSALLGNACATPTAEEKQHEQYEQLSTSLKDEKEVGRQMAAKLIGSMGLYDNPDVSKYVSLVGLTVAAQSSRPEITYHFGILKSDEVNALATPGGYIFVTTGLLKSLRSESELAGILGHEIAHVTERHMYSEIMPKRQVSAAETMTRLLSRGASDIGFSLGKIVNAGMDLLLEKGLGPEKESEADSVGIAFAMSAGYSANSLLEYLRYLADQTSGVRVSKTHPPFPERITNLLNYMQKNGIYAKSRRKSSALLQGRFSRAMSLLQIGVADRVDSTRRAGDTSPPDEGVKSLK
ncbi:MAG: M48 family metalloprotease [Bdellovibrionia bacterium]